MSLFVELKRRNVLRAGVLYIGAAWAFGQGLSQFSPALGLPDRTTRWFLVAAAIGFPFWIAFAWFYEFTPQGLKRESGIAPDDSAAHATGRKLDKWIIGVLALAVVLLLTNQFVLHRGGNGDTNVANSRSVAAVLAKIPAKSVAVLPFENLSGDPSEKYFSDGITEEILNALAQISDLKVAGRTSAFQFTSKEGDPRRIGTTLGVANLLEGSVQKSGDEVRINVQLIDAHTGYQRWSEKYDRELTTIFAIEDDISNAIAGKLRVQLIGGAGQALVAQKTIDPRAHDFYLRGLSLLAARGPGLRDAVAAFQSAVKIAPNYAQAWGALANAEALLPNYRLQDKTALARAQAFAKRALALDANTASAYGALGIVYIERWQWAQGEQAFRHSLALAPNDAEAVDQYAQFLFATGQFEPALAEIERAQRLDPLSAVIGAIRAWLLFVLRRNQEAATQISSTLAAHPDFALAHSIAVMIDVHAGRFTQALTQARSSLRPNATVLLARGMADPAMRDQAAHEMETSPTFSALRNDPLVFAQYLTLLGAHAHALDVLESLTEDQATSNPQEIWDPSLDPIRNDPRFKAVLKKMGLPYTSKASDGAMNAKPSHYLPNGATK